MITAQIDSFEQCIPELVEIFPTHWNELALFKDQMPLAPQYDEYVRREREGRLFLATVRWNGKIVGYYTAQVSLGFHYGTTLTGTMDMLYVVPEVRDRGLIVPLMKCVERELRRRGVKVWHSGFKTSKPNGLPEIHKMFGFIPADSYSAKWLS